MSCVIYFPEMSFRDKQHFEGFSRSSLDTRRFSLRCSLCDSFKGACLQCSAKGCRNSYHPSCARLSKTPLYFSVEPNNTLNTVLWCKEHVSNQSIFTKRTKSFRQWKPVTTRQSKNSEWHFTTRLSVFPRNKKFEVNKNSDGELLSQSADNPDDRNRWSIVSTTDLRSKEAFDAHNLIASQWDETIVGNLDHVIERRMSRKAVGYSSLINPSGEILVAANWNFWEVNTEIVCMCIKFMVCRAFTEKHISMRRKGCGSLLAAHLIDLALTRKKVEWVLVCSEGGYPEKFWQKLGFKMIPKKERARFSVVSEAELNPFRDTVLMRITRKEVMEEDGDSVTGKVFEWWSKKHCRDCQDRKSVV